MALPASLLTAVGASCRKVPRTSRIASAFWSAALFSSWRRWWSLTSCSAAITVSQWRSSRWEMRSSFSRSIRDCIAKMFATTVACVRSLISRWRIVCVSSPFSVGGLAVDRIAGLPAGAGGVGVLAQREPRDHLVEAVRGDDVALHAAETDGVLEDPLGRSPRRARRRGRPCSRRSRPRRLASWRPRRRCRAG